MNAGIDVREWNLGRMLDVLSSSLRDAIRSNHRRMVVLTGKDEKKIGLTLGLILRESLRLIRDKKGLADVNVIYAYKPAYEDAKIRLEIVKGMLKENAWIRFEAINYAESEKVLGMTYDAAVLDLINDLRPNDVGRLVGIVRGGGLIVLMTPSFEDWVKRITEFQELLSTPQHPKEEVRHIFIKRFIKKLKEHEGIMIYDVDRDEALKMPGKMKKYEVKKRELKLPEKGRFQLRVYKLALTQDQVEVLKLMEKLFKKPKKGKKLVLVITADRGRGKSCAVGIGLASLAHRIKRIKGLAKIAVTAPSVTNVQSLMMLAKRALEVMGYEVEIEGSEAVIKGLKAKGIRIRYLNPIDLLSSNPDIIAVDEAAGLQVPMLHKIWRRFSRAVFSSTIHGYEGAGRGFSIRFLKRIRDDPNTKLLEYEMHEPIRYAEDDPIEKWLFDSLLLDAEPVKLSEKDYELIDAKRVRYIAPNLEDWFAGSDEGKLREFVGIYILAHYRNRPNDLAMMADAPHHTIRALMLPNGKIVTSIELAEEGPIPEDMIEYLKYGGWIHGNVIPDRFLKHARDERFAKYAGWRIVRIATHPDAMDRGLGTLAIKEICEEALERGYGWVGAGFGVNYRLLRFWIRNGFIPIHISPERNPVSGEYTVIVVKPLKDDVKEIILRANKEFRLRLLNSLVDPYDDLEPRVARLLLRTWGEPVFEGYKPKLTEVQLERAENYAWSAMTLESASDCMRELTLAYFYNDETSRPQLSELQELMLITKVLQARSWKNACDELGLAPPVLMNGLKDIAKALLKYYFGIGKKDVT